MDTTTDLNSVNNIEGLLLAVLIVLFVLFAITEIYSFVSRIISPAIYSVKPNLFH